VKVSDFPVTAFVRQLRTPGVWLYTGTFQIHLRTSIDFLASSIHLLYGDFPVEENPQFADFHVRMEMSKGVRRFYRPYVTFSIDGETPFRPLPLDEAVAMLEWCLNWCIETRAHQYLIIHAAVVEKHRFAVILPAPPGSGKSTLTAALISRGWRLLSDELTLIDPTSGLAIPIARPVGLKNESIEVIRNFVPDAVIGPLAWDRTKGTIAHLKPPAESVERVSEKAVPQCVIFPEFRAGSPAILREFSKPNALLRLADSAFNYSQHGIRGFETLSTLVEGCGCYEFTYSSLDEAIAQFDLLVSEPISMRV
jgi:HprK-related kinase A